MSKDLSHSMDDIIKELTFSHDAIDVYIKPTFSAHLSQQN